MSHHEELARHLAVLLEQRAVEKPDGTKVVLFTPRLIFDAMRDIGMCWICHEPKCDHTPEEQRATFARQCLGRPVLLLRFSPEGELLP